MPRRTEGRRTRHGNARLTWEIVRWVRASDPKTPPVPGVKKLNSREVAEQLGVTSANVRHIRRGITWQEK